jgi:hypothetical protein
MLAAVNRSGAVTLYRPWKCTTTGLTVSYYFFVLRSGVAGAPFYSATSLDEPLNNNTATDYLGCYGYTANWIKRTTASAAFW